MTKPLITCSQRLHAANNGRKLGGSSHNVISPHYGKKPVKADIQAVTGAVHLMMAVVEKIAAVISNLLMGPKRLL
jgi:hypothetical protein